MDLEIISKEVVKPSKPTLNQLKSHKLSILDQLSPSIYAPILLFYQAPSTPHTSIDLSMRLRSSLGEALDNYYPFAGEVEDNVQVKCEDRGALFLEARSKSKLDDILKVPKLKILNSLFPDDLQWNSSRNSSVLAVQVTYFDCGGYSIGICISHKIADACTISSFLQDWASLTRKSGETIQPLFNTASLFPPSDHFVIPELEHVRANVVTTRFVFHPTKISELKAIATSNLKGLHKPTRVEVVTSIIYKSIIQATKIKPPVSNKSFVLAQVVNIRPRMVPPLPNYQAGNIVWYFPVAIKGNEDPNLESLIIQMREGLEKLCENTRNLDGKEWLPMVAESMKDASEQRVNEAYTVSTWCKCPLYQVNFGWGSPIWVSTAEYPYGNSIILLDSRNGDGIEAWVTLNEQVMEILQGDDEFMKFAAPNPSIY